MSKGSVPDQEGEGVKNEASHQSERFMDAISRVERVFGQWGEQHGKLSSAAQTYEFTASQPELAGNLSGARESLRQAIDSSVAPEEIVSIYRELYPEVLDQEQQLGQPKE